MKRLLWVLLLSVLLLSSAGCASWMDAAGGIARSQIWSDLYAFVLDMACESSGYCQVRVARVNELPAGQLIKADAWTMPETEALGLQSGDVIRVDPGDLIGNWVQAIDRDYDPGEVPRHLHSANVEIARQLAAHQAAASASQRLAPRAAGASSPSFELKDFSVPR
ncbi:MAG: hypothetical protein AAGM22_33650 [Acidobacteriota bacterium]